MKESYSEGLASHIGPESCLDGPRGRGEALTGGSAGGLLSSEITSIRRPSELSGVKALQSAALGEWRSAPAESEYIKSLSPIAQ